jgi:hypothetical protein
MFFDHWETQDNLLSKLQGQPSGFGRGLPQDFTDMSVLCLDLLREIVGKGKVSVVDLDNAPTSLKLNAEEQKRAGEARKIIQSGWVYATSDGIRESASVILQFASPLHRAWFSSYLQRGKSLPPTVSDLDATWNEVLSHFSASALRDPICTPVSSRNATFVEGQYQQEFYCSLYSLTGGAFCVSPEYGGRTSSEKKGRIDFFIGSKGWGIELLLDGDRIPGHISRILAGGAYHPWFASGQMKEYAILDFRQTRPTKPSCTCFWILCSPSPH